MRQNKDKFFGLFAENIASKYLVNKGYSIIMNNYSKPWGEVDIVAKKDDILIFIEVKANFSSDDPDFSPEQRVDQKKIKTIIRVAQSYMSENADSENGWQIDAIGVTIDNKLKKAIIKHYKNIAVDIN